MTLGYKSMAFDVTLTGHVKGQIIVSKGCTVVIEGRSVIFKGLDTSQ